jgi:hypothetical protein
MCRIAAKFVPQLLTNDQKQQHATIITVEQPKIPKSKKGVAGPEFNKEHAHCFF